MKTLQLTLLAVALLLVAFFVALHIAKGRYQPFTDAYHHSGGSSAKLAMGRLNYQWHGPADGEIVVLVHGFSTPSLVWQNTIPALVAAGYRVLSFDHFGRGHSERLAVAYNRKHYVTELQQLLDHLQITEPVSLVGYSMGGGNVVSFAATQPQRVKQLVLLAPAGFIPPYSGLSRVLSWPWIGEQLLTLAGAERLMAELLQASETGVITADTAEQFKTQFYIQGSPYALASTLRHYPMYNLADDYQQVGNSKLPVTAIWGDADQVVPYDGAAQMQQRLPQLDLHTVPGAQHDFTFTQADLVNPLILKALSTP